MKLGVYILWVLGPYRTTWT